MAGTSIRQGRMDGAKATVGPEGAHADAHVPQSRWEEGYPGTLDVEGGIYPHR